jgi:hypothetical protein
MLQLDNVSVFWGLNLQFRKILVGLTICAILGVQILSTVIARIV